MNTDTCAGWVGPSWRVDRTDSEEPSTGAVGGLTVLEVQKGTPSAHASHTDEAWATPGSTRKATAPRGPVSVGAPRKTSSA